MTDQPNRHSICYTVTLLDDGLANLRRHSCWLPTGASYEGQLSHVYQGGSDVAAAALADAISSLSQMTESQDGYHRAIKCSNFRVHSWFARSPAEVMASFAPPPMSGPENDQAWIDGPGSDAL